MAGGDAGLEDQVDVGVGYAAAVVYHGEGAEAAAGERGGDQDVSGAGVAGVAEKLGEGVLDVGYPGGAAAGALDAGKAGEAGAQVPVGSVQL